MNTLKEKIFILLDNIQCLLAAQRDTFHVRTVKRHAVFLNGLLGNLLRSKTAAANNVDANFLQRLLIFVPEICRYLVPENAESIENSYQQDIVSLLDVVETLSREQAQLITLALQEFRQYSIQFKRSTRNLLPDSSLPALPSLDSFADKRFGLIDVGMLGLTATAMLEQANVGSSSVTAAQPKFELTPDLKSLEVQCIGEILLTDIDQKGSFFRQALHHLQQLKEKYGQESLVNEKQKLLEQKNLLEEAIRHSTEVVTAKLLPYLHLRDCSNLLLWLWDTIHDFAYGDIDEEAQKLLNSISAACLGKAAASPASSNHRQTLWQLRHIFQAAITSDQNNFLPAQQEFVKGLQGLLEKMIAEVQQYIGQPLHRLCFLSLGSLSRQDSLPYSDVEYAVLEDPQNDYDQAYTRIFLKLMSMSFHLIGEYQIGHGTGFQLDNTGNPDSEPSLRFTLTGVLTNLVSNERQQVFELYHTNYLAADKTLWQSYQEQLAQHLTAVRKNSGQRFLEKHFLVWNNDWSALVCCKEGLTGPLLYLLYDLFLYKAEGLACGLSACELIKNLTEQGIFEANFAADCQTALSNSQRIRAERQFRLCYQVKPELPEDRDLETFHYWQQHLLIPAYRQVPRLLANTVTLPFNPILEDFRCLVLANFYDKADTIRFRLETILKEAEAGKINLDLDSYDRLHWEIQNLAAIWEKIKVVSCDTVFWSEKCTELNDWLENFKFAKEQELAIITNKQQGVKLCQEISTALQEEQKKLIVSIPEWEGKLADTILNNLIFFFVRHNWADYAGLSCGEYYNLLPDPQRKKFWLAVQEIVPNDAERIASEILDHYPSEVGYRPGARTKRERFEQSLTSLTTQSASRLGMVCPIITRGVIAANLDEKKCAALLNVAKELKNKRPQNIGHNHLVHKIGDYYFKFFPEIPGYEVAVSLLHELIIGHGCSCSVLARITINGENYPVLISQAVQGESLEKVLYEKQQIEIEGRSFSQLALMALLIQPEDGKPDNYIWQNGHLVSIDSDHVFGVPIIEKQGWTQERIMTKTILFCCARMQEPFAAEALQEFFTLNPCFILSTWLGDLNLYSKEVEKLFTPQESNIWSKNTIKKEYYQQMSLVHLRLPPGLIGKLYQQMTALQDLLKENRSLTPLQILTSIDQRVGNFYQDLLEKTISLGRRFSRIAERYYEVKRQKCFIKLLSLPIKQVSSLETSDNCLIYLPNAALGKNWYLIISNAEQKSIRGLLADLVMEHPGLQVVLEALQGKTDSIEKVELGRIKEDIRFALGYGTGKTSTLPLQMLTMSGVKQEEMTTYTLEKNFQELEKITWQYHHLAWLKSCIEAGEWQLLKTLSPYFQVCLINRLNWEKIVDETARFKILSFLKSSKEKLISAVTKLSFTDCAILNSKQLGYILDNKEWLQSLKIVGCVALEEIVLPSLPNLVHLEVRNCGALKSLRIASEIKLEKLQRIEVNDCKQLRNLEVKSTLPALREAKITKCELLITSLPLGLEAYNLKNWRLALMFLRNAQTVSRKEHTEANYYLGLTYLHLCNWQEARASFLQAIQHGLWREIDIANAAKDLLTVLEKLWTNYEDDFTIIISALLQALRDKDSWSVRARAAEALGKLGQGGNGNPEVIPALLQALRDTDNDVRARAAEALVKLGPGGNGNPEVIPALLQALRDKEYNVRASAAEALGKLGQGGNGNPEVIPALLQALRDMDNDVRARAAEALGKIGPGGNAEVIPALLQALRDTDNDLRARAAEALGKIGPGGNAEVIPALLQALRDTDNDLRARAAEALVKLGQEGNQEVILALLQALRDTWGNVRVSTVEALVKLGQGGNGNLEVIPALLQALRDKEYNVRASAAEVLVKLGQGGNPEVIPALLQALRDTNNDVRASAAEALGKLGQGGNGNPEVIPALLQALRDKDSWSVRARAAEALGKLGQGGNGNPEVIPALLQALRDTDNDIRARAVEALVKLGQGGNQEVILALLQALRDTDNDVRARAAEALGKLGQGGNGNPEVIPALLQALRDTTWNVRARAAEALGKLGQGGNGNPEVISALLQALRDKDSWSVRARAAEALGKLGQGGNGNPEVIPALLQALRDTNNDVRARAAEALGKLGQGGNPEVIPALLQALRDTDNDVRARAAEALVKLGQGGNPEVIPALLQALRDTDNDVRARAAEALVKLGQGGNPEVIPALLQALRDKDSWSVRARAAEALGKLGQGGNPEVILALLQALRDTDNDVRASAAEALGKLGQEGNPEVIPALLQALRDTNNDVRARAAEALGKLGQEGNPEVIPALLQALRDTNNDVRARAAEALGKLGQGGNPEVIPALLQALRDTDNDVRARAAEALVKLGQGGNPEVIPALLQALRDTDNDVRARAAEALVKLGQGGNPEVIPALLQALRDKDSWSVRARAAEALGKLGQGGNPEVILALLQALRDTDNDVRASAAEALGKLGQEGNPEVIPALLQALRDTNNDVRARAAEALGKLGQGGNPEVIPALLQALRDTDNDVRARAAEALGKLGQGGNPEVIPALLQALRDTDNDVRARAAKALGKLGQGGSPEVILALLQDFRDVRWSVRASAAEALGKIYARIDNPSLYLVPQLGQVLAPFIKPRLPLFSTTTLLSETAALALIERIPVAIYSKPELQCFCQLPKVSKAWHTLFRLPEAQEKLLEARRLLDPKFAAQSANQPTLTQKTCLQNCFINQAVVKKCSGKAAIELANAWKNPQTKGEAEARLVNFVLQKQTALVNSVADELKATLVFYQGTNEIYRITNACTTETHIQCKPATMPETNSNTMSPLALAGSTSTATLTPAVSIALTTSTFFSVNPSSAVVTMTTTTTTPTQSLLISSPRLAEVASNNKPK